MGWGGGGVPLDEEVNYINVEQVEELDFQVGANKYLGKILKYQLNSIFVRIKEGMLLFFPPLPTRDS